MATGTTNGVLGHLRRVVLSRGGGDLADGELLECFLVRREEAAFEALVRRHGPMVLGVCRRLLANECDAEDAFQATFLVLARKAAAVVPRGLVGNWLYGVAYRTALKARTAAARRRAVERQVKTMPEPATEPEDVWHDLQPLLDHELQRLPDKYRVPVVLCELEGRTRKEAARQLGIPEGTLSSRLAAARKTLAQRLARRGLTLSAGSLALLLSQQAASAGVPAPLVGPTVAAATLFAAGQATAGVIPAKAAVLADAVLKSMLLTKLKVATGLLLALSVLGAGAGIVATRTAAAERDNNTRAGLEQKADPAPEPVPHQADPKDDGRKGQEPESRKNPKDDDDDDDDDQKYQGVVKALDVPENTITLTVKRKGEENEQSFELARTVRVQMAGKSAGLSDVKTGARVVLKLSKDRKAVVEIKEAKGQDKDNGRRNNKDAGSNW